MAFKRKALIELSFPCHLMRRGRVMIYCKVLAVYECTNLRIYIWGGKCEDAHEDIGAGSSFICIVESLMLAHLSDSSIR